MPPGFMNATTASPKSVGEVEASWASAITSPSADSPAALFVFVMSADCDPTTRLAIGPESASYLLMIAVSAESFATSRVTITLCAVALMMSFVCPEILEVDVRDQPAERGCARDELPIDPADVGLMGVRRDDDVHLRAQPVHDRDDVAAEVVAAIGVLIAEREGPALEAALMDEDDERAHALLVPQL